MQWVTWTGPSQKVALLNSCLTHMIKTQGKEISRIIPKGWIPRCCFPIRLLLTEFKATQTLQERWINIYPPRQGNKARAEEWFHSKFVLVNQRVYWGYLQEYSWHGEKIYWKAIKALMKTSERCISGIPWSTSGNSCTLPQTSILPLPPQMVLQ